MNRKTTYLLFILLLLAASATYGKKKSEIRLVQNLCEYRNDTLYIGINIDLSRMNIKPRQSIVISPVLMSESGSIEMPGIIINGKGKVRLSKRPAAYKKENIPVTVHDLIINRNRKAEEEVYYLATLPYQEWMDSAGLYINEELYGCSSKEQLILFERMDLPAVPESHRKTPPVSHGTEKQKE